MSGQPWLYAPPLCAYRFDLPANEVVAFARAPAETVEDHFLRSALPLAWHLRGGECMHAAAVCAPRGVVVLCGSAGTGKSTTAWGLAAQGFPLWADDVVAAVPDPHPTVIPLPFRPRLLPDAAAALSAAPASTVTPATEPAPLAAVCMLERCTQAGAPAVSVSPLTGAAALAALLANAYYFDTGDPDRLGATTRVYLDLAAKAPLFTVRFRPGLEHLARVLAAIESVAAGQP